MRRRKVPTFNERKIARLENEKNALERSKKEQADSLRHDYDRRLDALREKIVVKERQTLLGERPKHAVQKVAIIPGHYGCRSLNDERNWHMYGMRSIRVATFEWKRVCIEIPTGDPDAEPVYVVWFVPEFKGVSM